MQNASKVSNGFKSILVNLVNKDLEEQFNQFGISTKYANGAMKDAYTILQELSVEFNKLGTVTDESSGDIVSLDSAMNKLLEDVGGKYNINVLTSSLQNFDTAINVTETSLNSTGSAQKEFATALDSIDKRLEGLAGSFTQLVTDGYLTDFIKLLLTATQSILDFANSGVGQTIIQLSLLATAITLVSAGMKTLKFQQFIGWFITLSTAIKGVTASTITLDTALKMLNLNPIVLGVSALILVVASAVAVSDALNGAMEEQLDHVSELKSEYDEITENIKTLESELQTTVDRLKELNTIKTPTLVEQEEILKLENINRQLEIQIANEKYLQSLKNQELYKDTSKALNKTDLTSYFSKDRYDAGMPSITTDALNLEDQFKTYLQSYKDLELVIQELQIEQSKLINSDGSIKDENKTKFDDLSYTIEHFTNMLGDTKLAISEVGTSLNGLSEGMDVTDERGETAQNNLLELIKNGFKYVGILEKTENTTKDNADVLSYSAEQLATQADLVESSAEAYDNASDSVVNMKDSFEDLNSIVSDYNSNNGWTLDSLEKLINMGDEYVSLLQFENGQMSINEQGAIALAHSLISTAQAGAALEAQTRLEQIAMEQANGAITGAGNAEDTVAVQTNNLTNEFAKLSTQAVITAQNMANLLGTEAMGAMGSEADSIRSNLLTTLNAYQSIRGSIGSYTTAVGSSGGSSGGGSGATGATDEFTEALKREKEALEEVQEALEKQIDEYEIVIDYVKDKIKEEQEAVEDEKDTVLGAIQDKIDALEDEQEAWENNLDLKIDRLEKEADAWEESAEKEKQALQDKIDAEEEYWDKQIDDYNKANEVIAENIELQQLQEALANAKANKVMVLKDGKFVYAENEGLVSKAQDDLANYEKELAVQKHLEELESAKENAINSLNQQLEELESFVDKTVGNYNQQVENLKELKDNQNSIYGQQVYDIQEKIRLTNLANEDDRDEKLALYEQELADLYNSADRTKGSYDQQLEDLQSHYDKVQIEYDTAVGKYDTYLDSFENMLSASTDAQAKLLYDQYIGEQDNWNDRLIALDKFVKEYESKQKQLTSIKAKITNSSSSSVGSSVGSSGNSANSNPTNAKQSKDWYVYYSSPSTGKSVIVDTLKSEKEAYLRATQLESDPYIGGGYLYTYSDKIPKYAKGSYSIKEDEIAFVGDKPNTETLIGTKYNKSMGIPMNLAKGTGIIPAKESSTLASMMTNLARGNSYQQVSNNNGTTQNISIDKMIIEGVQNATDFAQELSTKFRNIAMQKAY